MISVSRPSGRRRGERVLRRGRRGYGSLFAVALVMVSVLVAGTPLERSMAVLGGGPSRSGAAQVRIFVAGTYLVGGTLVSRNWVLTSAHLLARHVVPGSVERSRLSLRFGVVDDRTDATDSRNLRLIDRIEWNPELADAVLVHFADPVPEGTWIPRLATEAPRRREPTLVYGWGPDAHVLNRVATVVVDPVASQNIAYLRTQSTASIGFYFRGDMVPMVIDATTQAGDSGSGSFSRDGHLLGVHSGLASYRRVNGSGNLYGATYGPAYQTPVWLLQDWIRRVISGEGTSGSSVPDEELRRRRLADSEFSGDGSLPMTMPPPVDVCDPGEGSCRLPEPTWVQADVTGAGNYRGTALAVCAPAAGDSCSFAGTAYARGAVARLELGPSQAPGTAPRQVMVWCTTSAVFADGAPARPAWRISFTNADPAEVPVGFGWWDVTPDQVRLDAGQPAVGPDRFIPC
jgi:hypothetical protein